MLLRRNSTAVSDLYDRYASWLRTALGARYGTTDAEDLAQDVWLRVIPYSTQTEIRHPPSLLLKIAANLVADRASTKARLSIWEISQSGHRDVAVCDAQTDELLAKEIILGLPQPLRDLGVRDRFDVEQNLFAGADYLARQLLRFGDLRLALAAYNSGPGRVARLGRVPRIPETEQYVLDVIDCFLMLTAGRGARSAPQCRARRAGP